MGYSAADGVRQKFTQKERDNETGLDFFEARYYSSIQGRFTSVDPILTSARKNHPQTWNRYTYVLNNPLALVDPYGLQESAAELARRLQQERRNQPVEVRDVTIATEIQMRPMELTIEQQIDRSNSLFAPLTGDLLTNANQAIQDAAQMTAAPQPGAPVNLCRAAMSNFGNQDPATAMQGAVTTGGSLFFGVDGLQVGAENVFDGNASAAEYTGDSGQPTTAADYLDAHPSVNAITNRRDGYIFLDDSFNGLERLGRAQVMLHERVVHVANRNSDPQWAPAGSTNPRISGSNRINEIIRQNCNRLPN